MRQLLNNAFALVPMGALSYYFGEPGKWARLREATIGDSALLFASCINAVGISYAGINAQGYVSATTFMVLSNLNKFVVVAFGMIWLREASSWQVRRRHRSCHITLQQNHLGPIIVIVCVYYLTCDPGVVLHRPLWASIWRSLVA